MRDINCKPNQNEVFIWNIMGSLFNSLLSVITLMVVTRMLQSDEADIFSIGWSISQIMATIGTYQIRMYQATDVTEKFKFGQYLIFRIFTLIVMIVCSVGYLLSKHYDIYKTIVIFIICLIRLVESLADVYEGYFQQKERLDLVGKAITYRIFLAIILFSASLMILRNLLISCLILLICYICSFIVFNVRYSLKVKAFDIKEKWTKNERWVWSLVKEGFPIFVNSFLMTAIINIPKIRIDYVIEQGRMESGMQTVFNILFMPASVLTLIYIVFRPLLTKMAIEWNAGRKKGFLKIVGMIFICLLGISIIVLGGSAWLGIPILSILYGLDLSKYRMELLIMITGGCLCTFSYVFDNALIVIRRQYLLLFSYVLSWLYIEIVIGKMVDKWGVLGAAFAYSTSMMVFLIVTFLIFIICLRKDGKELKEQ